MRNVKVVYVAALCLAAAWGATIFDIRVTDAQCPPNTFDRAPFPCPALAEQTPGPLKAVAMKWSCVIGSPACDNPALVNETSFKNMLWRRHERASDCIWIDQCNITLRSAAVNNAELRGEFAQLADNDTTLGDPGDVVFCLPVGAFGPCPGVTDDNQQPQVMAVFDAAASAWGDVNKGIVAVSVNKIIAQNGTPFARGLVVTSPAGGMVTTPWIIIKDPTEMCENNERTLASMIGEVLTLPNITTANNLMRPLQPGEPAGVLLTPAQCQQARDYLDTPDGMILDPPSLAFSDQVYDGLERDIRPGEKYLDLLNSVVIDSGQEEEKVVFCAGAAGADILARGPGGETGPICIIFALDCDANEDTGDNATLVAPGLDFDGAEFVAELLVDRETSEVVPVLRAATGLGFFVNVQFEPGAFVGNARDGIIRVVPEPGFQGPMAFPFNMEFQATLSSQFFAAALEELGVGAGDDGKTFPAGLRFQVATSHGQGMPVVDMNPPETVMVDFVEDTFPEMVVKRRVGRGQTIEVSVTDMPANVPVHALVGPFEVESRTVRTDANGSARLQLGIPEDAPLGAALLTIGVDDPDNAVTADGVLRIVECAPDLDGDGELTIFDFLAFQNSWQGGEDAGDYDGDGELTVFDFLAYQNDYEASCP